MTKNMFLFIVEQPSSFLFKIKICSRRCSTRYLKNEVQQRINGKKRTSIKRLKENTLGCFEFFLLHTLDCMPCLLDVYQLPAWLIDLFNNTLPSFVSSCLSFFLSPSTSSIQQTSITYTLNFSNKFFLCMSRGNMACGVSFGEDLMCI